jgi:Rod binding domain-containing protein
MDAPLLAAAPHTPTAGPPAATAAAPDPKLLRVAEEFEALVLAQLLQPMFAALPTDGVGGGGFGEDMFRPMLVDEYAKGIARSGGIGLARSLVAELSRLQVAQAETAP